MNDNQESFNLNHNHDGQNSQQVFEKNINFRDITNNNASTSKHGYLAKLSGNANQFLTGTGTFTTVSLTAGVSGILPQANGGTGATSIIGALFGTNDLTAQSAAVSSIITATAPNDGVAHQYNVGGYITITAISVNTISLQVDYTDETSTSRTQSFFPEGLTSAALATTGAFGFPPMTIRAKFNTAITIKTITVGAGSQVYDVGGNIQRIN